MHALSIDCERERQTVVGHVATAATTTEQMEVIPPARAAAASIRLLAITTEEDKTDRMAFIVGMAVTPLFVIT